MKEDGETVRMMMHIGALMRLSTRDLVNEPMMEELRRLLNQLDLADSNDGDAVDF
jgi:hypothetical protein